MNKAKGKKNNSNIESESDESNHLSANLDLSVMRQPIATSITGFDEVLRAYEAGTNEVRSIYHRSGSILSLSIFLPMHSCVNCYRVSAI